MGRKNRCTGLHPELKRELKREKETVQEILGYITHNESKYYCFRRRDSTFVYMHTCVRTCIWDKKCTSCFEFWSKHARVTGPDSTLQVSYLRKEEADLLLLQSYLVLLDSCKINVMIIQAWLHSAQCWCKRHRGAHKEQWPQAQCYLTLSLYLGSQMFLSLILRLYGWVWRQEWSARSCFLRFLP